MAGKKTPVDQLNKAVMDMLMEYKDELGDNMTKIVEGIGKKGRQALRRNSRRVLKTHSGDYAKGWQVKIEKKRLITTATFYNDHYSMPHLLEYSHDITNEKDGPLLGKKHTTAYPHIAPVEKELVDTFEREVLRKL